MKDRVHDVVTAVIESVRQALTEKQVTLEEYRAAVNFLNETAAAGELPLLSDVYFNITIVENENAQHQGTRADLEGPYYLPNAPFLEDEIKTMEAFEGEAMLIQGRVTDTAGAPLAGAVLDIWQSTPDGKYSGIHDNIPVEYYRGKVRTDSEGRYRIKSTVPVPYEIPNKGPTGKLLQMMGSHTWRPAHIHFKAMADGHHPLTMQAYFEGGEWVNDDCCSGKCNEGQNIIPKKYEGGTRVMDIDIVLDKAA
ncbi:MAG: catechol 1,2-dioxygenase [Halieaceae bacterium]|nr:catechol 1,2-dioxygenase [Halieaceae bacterium]